MARALEKDRTLVRDGRSAIQIRGMTGLASYPRQRLKRHETGGKTRTLIPINDFFENIRPGIGVVSRNAEAEIIKTATEHSYRKTEAIMKKKLGKETIRRGVLQRGETAKALPHTRIEERVIPEKKMKDAGDQHQTYKNSQGGSIRQRFGALCKWLRIYLLIDGVQVFQKEKGANGEESRECKVGVIVRQQSGKVLETAAWCTWGRIKAFRAMTALAFLAAATTLNVPVVIVSDGAKWIRNVRKWIPGLRKAVWILDWFHLRDHLLKCLRMFNVEEASEIARTLIGLLWNGKADEAARMIKELPRAADTEKRNAELAAVTNFLVYLDNQREGIINYEEYQKNGYIVGSGFVEKLNDTLIKNRMVRGKRMRWSLQGGEAMMALLAAKHNGRLQEVFA